jgi:hypothetical protein
MKQIYLGSFGCNGNICDCFIHFRNVREAKASTKHDGSLSLTLTFLWLYFGKFVGTACENNVDINGADLPWFLGCKSNICDCFIHSRNVRQVKASTKHDRSLSLTLTFLWLYFGKFVSTGCDNNVDINGADLPWFLGCNSNTCDCFYSFS